MPTVADLLAGFRTRRARHAMIALRYSTNCLFGPHQCTRHFQAFIFCGL